MDFIVFLVHPLLRIHSRVPCRPVNQEAPAFKVSVKKHMINNKLNRVSALLFLPIALAVMVGLFHPSLASTAHSATVTLAWDPNPEPSVAGFGLYLGTSPGYYTVPWTWRPRRKRHLVLLEGVTYTWPARPTTLGNQRLSTRSCNGAGRCSARAHHGLFRRWRRGVLHRDGRVRKRHGSRGRAAEGIQGFLPPDERPRQVLCGFLLPLFPSDCGFHQWQRGTQADHEGHAVAPGLGREEPDGRRGRHRDGAVAGDPVRRRPRQEAPAREADHPALRAPQPPLPQGSLKGRGPHAVQKAGQKVPSQVRRARPAACPIFFWRGCPRRSGASLRRPSSEPDREGPGDHRIHGRFVETVSETHVEVDVFCERVDHPCVDVSGRESDVLSGLHSSPASPTSQTFSTGLYWRKGSPTRCRSGMRPRRMEPVTVVLVARVGTHAPVFLVIGADDRDTVGLPVELVVVLASGGGLTDSQPLFFISRRERQGRLDRKLEPFLVP